MKHELIIMPILFIAIMALVLCGCENKMAIQNEIKEMEAQIEDIQNKIYTINQRRSEEIALARKSAIPLIGAPFLDKANMDHTINKISKINFEADSKVEKLQYQRDQLSNKVLVLMGKL